MKYIKIKIKNGMDGLNRKITQMRILAWEIQRKDLQTAAQKDKDIENMDDKLEDTEIRMSMYIYSTKNR